MADDMLSLSTGPQAASAKLVGLRSQARFVAFTEAVGERLVRAMRAAAPRGKGPHAGELANSIRYERLGIGVTTLRFHSDAPHAPFVIRATRPHDIVPRAARALHWQAPGGGDVFARRVRHPGTKANDFPARVLREQRAAIIAELRAAYERTTLP